MSLTRWWWPQTFLPRLYARLLRLPQFDLVAIRVIHPGEPAVVSLFALWVDARAICRQLCQNRVQIVHDVVDHEGRGAGIEVGGCAGKHIPGSHHFPVRIVVGAPVKLAAVGPLLDPEIAGIPGGELFLVRGLQEYAANAQHSSFFLSHYSNIQSGRWI